MKLFSKTIPSFIVLVFGCTNLAKAVDDDDVTQCVLPQGQENIDWKKMEGVWYEILNLKTPVDELAPCIQTSNVKETTNGIQFVIKDTKKDNSITINAVKQESGGYVWDQSHVQDYIEYVKEEIYPLRVPSAALMEESMEIFTEEAVYFTDYKNYVLILRCTKKGQKLFWISSRFRNPTAETIVTIYNKFIEIGKGWNDIPLFLAACVRSRK